MKTLDQFISKTDTIYDALNKLKNKKVKIKQNNALRSGGTVLKKEFTIKSFTNWTNAIDDNKKNIKVYLHGLSSWYYADEIYLSGFDTKEDIEERIKELDIEKKNIDDEINLCKNKLKYLKDAKTDEFNETEYKSFMVIQELNRKDISDYEKAKLIAKIVDGE